VSEHVVIVGAGVAGLAAAWSARRSGRAVTLVSAGAGASALGSGAVDDVPWEQLVRAARVLREGPKLGADEVAPDVRAFVDELDLWDVPARERPYVATIAGRIRPARGRDRALLDLGRLDEGALVIVPRADRAGWDADAISATLAGDPFARAKKLAFHAVDLAILRYDDEHRIGDADLAARHDDEARVAWLAGRLREGLAATPGASAILLGPWLGTTAPRAGNALSAALARALGVAVGEALCGVGSPAGLRFEAARDRLLDQLGVKRVRDRVTRVAGSDKLAITLAREEAPLIADRVVLAIGGIAGGGVIYAPPEREAGAELPPAGRVPYALSLEADVTLSAGGASQLGVIASMHGPELDEAAWPTASRLGTLEAIGILCDGVRAGARITAAGDAIAGRPRTVLEAVSSGIAAGTR
jgi:glycerol-3-phosphate dehydrogenase subunit B